MDLLFSWSSWICGLTCPKRKEIHFLSKPTLNWEQETDLKLQFNYSFYKGITDSEKKKWRIFMVTLSVMFFHSLKVLQLPPSMFKCTERCLENHEDIAMSVSVMPLQQLRLFN